MWRFADVSRLIAFCLAVTLAPALVAAEYPDPERFRTAVDAFGAQPVSPGAIIATGSSSMRGWHRRIHQDLAPLSIVPRGFGGSNMSDVRYFLNELVLEDRPKAVLLYEGDNDVALGASPDEILGHFDAIVSGIHAELPDTRIYVLAVKPSIARWQMWDVMQTTNGLLRSRCDENPQLTFIDVATPMLGEDGAPMEHLFVQDMLHMTDAGYDIWRDAVRPVLVER